MTLKAGDWVLTYRKVDRNFVPQYGEIILIEEQKGLVPKATVMYPDYSKEVFPLSYCLPPNSESTVSTVTRKNWKGLIARTEQ